MKMTKVPWKRKRNKRNSGRGEKIPEVTGFPELISWKTADIPSFGRDDEGLGGSELKSEADGGGGGAGVLGLGGAFGGADTVALLVALHTGPKGW